MNVCVICKGPISDERMERSSRIVTCSQEHSEEHVKNLRRKASRDYGRRNKEANREYLREYRIQNPGKAAAYMRDWRGKKRKEAAANTKP